MPEMRYYTVTQEREVKVWANSPIDAAKVGNDAFEENELPHEVAGGVTAPVRTRGLSVREDI